MPIAKLKSEFLDRRQKNPAYSLRAFARDIGLTPSQLSGLMSGKVGISRAKAALVAQKLELNEVDSKVFVLTAEKEFGRDKLNRENASQILAEIENELQFENMAEHHIEHVTDWRCFVVFEALELCKEKFSKDQEKYISDYFGFTLQTTREAINCLERAEQIHFNGKSWIQKVSHTTIPDDTTNQNSTKITLDFMALGQHAIRNRSKSEKESGVVVMAMSKGQMRNAKKLIRKFQSDFTKILSDPKEKKDGIFCLAMQLFPLDEESSKF